MYKLLLFILTTACISYVVTQGDIFKKLREWTTLKSKNKIWWFINEIMNCPLCFGFWAGIVVYLLPEWVYYPFVSSIMSYVIYLIIKKLKT